MNKVDIVMFIIIALIVVGFCSFFVPISIEDDVTIQKVWVTNAPFGIYWTDIHGGILFMRSDLSESYIVKYLDDNNQVHTIEMNAFDERFNKDKVYFTDDNTSMTIKCHHEHGKIIWGYKALNSYYYELYIPKTEICPEGWYENPELLEEVKYEMV